MQNLFSVKDKVVVVTGGSRGIGEMIAAGYLANGAKVYITSRKADVCDATAARLMETYGGECVDPLLIWQHWQASRVCERISQQGNPSGRAGQ